MGRSLRERSGADEKARCFVVLTLASIELGRVTIASVFFEYLGGPLPIARGERRVRTRSRALRLFLPRPNIFFHPEPPLAAPKGRASSEKRRLENLDK